MKLQIVKIYIATNTPPVHVKLLGVAALCYLYTDATHSGLLLLDLCVRFYVRFTCRLMNQAQVQSQHHT